MVIGVVTWYETDVLASQNCGDVYRAHKGECDHTVESIGLSALVPCTKVFCFKLTFRYAHQAVGYNLVRIVP